MTWYLRIAPLQEPFDLNLDQSSRAQVGFNIEVVKRPSETFEDEIVKILENASSLFVLRSTLFVGSQAQIPPGDGPFTSVVATGGPAGINTHNEVGGPSYRRPTAQIMTRAKSYVAARQRSWLAYDALSAVRNIEVLP